MFSTLRKTVCVKTIVNFKITYSIILANERSINFFKVLVINTLNFITKSLITMWHFLVQPSHHENVKESLKQIGSQINYFLKTSL